jgi:TPR repeat protein
MGSSFYYAYNLFNGIGVPKDMAEANRYYKLSADAGNPNAQCNLGSSYLGGFGVAKSAIR